VCVCVFETPELIRSGEPHNLSLLQCGNVWI